MLPFSTTAKQHPQLSFTLALVMITYTAFTQRSAAALFVLSIVPFTQTACGQTGTLYLPTEPAAKNRASLPESLLPSVLSPTLKPQPTPVRPVP